MSETSGVPQIPQLPLAALLVGGASTRFGTDKAQQLIEGRSFTDRILAAIDGAGLPVVLVGARPENRTNLDRRHIADEGQGSGPPGGLAAALRTAQREGRPGVLLLPCDQPGMTAGVIHWLVARAAQIPAAPLAFESANGLEPFPAYYPVAVLDKALGASSLREILASAHPATRVIPESERARFGEAAFMNINTPQDLRRFLKLRRQE